MSSLRSIVFVLSLAALAACSSSGSKSSGTSKKKESVDHSLQFTKGVSGESAYSVPGLCPSDQKTWETMNWKQLNTSANSCVKAGHWRVVQSLGQYMAQKFYHSPWGLYYLSVFHDQNGDKDMALWFVEAAIKKSKQPPGLLHYQKAKVLVSVGDYPGAYQSFEAAVNADPNLWDAHIYLGQQSYSEADYAKSIRHLSLAMENDRLKDSMHFYMLARSHEARKKWTDAVAVLDRALRVHKDSLELKMQRAKILEEGVQDLRAALRAYEDILKLQAKRSQNATSVRDKIDRLRKSLEQADKEERTPAAKGERA